MGASSDPELSLQGLSKPGSGITIADRLATHALPPCKSGMGYTTDGMKNSARGFKHGCIPVKGG
jgi:hypothetical protein